MIFNSYSSRTCRIWADNNQLGLRPRWLYISALITHPLIFEWFYWLLNVTWCTVQLRYIRTTHTRIIRSYFAYTRMSIRVYAYVYTRIRVCQYARICPFVMHSNKFLYMKHCWSNKGHVRMKRLQSEICILLKRHADEWKLSHFKFSTTSQIHRPFLWLLLDLISL